MGAVELVLQVEAPPSVAAGIQRLGRAGHWVGEISRGVLIPKSGGDLVEPAAVVEGMLDGRMESTTVPRMPLDVLAQQVVAMCAMDEWRVDELAAVVRRAYPYSELGPRSFESVLDMLSGRYPSDEFAELRPRIVWDRVAGTIRGRAGAQRLALTNAGTIPHPGLYTVNRLADGRRVGGGGRAGRRAGAPRARRAGAGGAGPDGRAGVVDGSREESGAGRVCLLTPLGGRVHAPLALALEGRLRERLGIDARALWTDDGIALHLPDVESPPGLDELVLDPEEVDGLISAQLPASALFAARFRENAARSLLLPRRRPGQRTPLWQQRMRSAGLLQVAGQYPDFPIPAQTPREIMTDSFDMAALGTLLRSIRSREVRVVAVDTERASPFASSLLFSYVAEFMYEGDSPLAERRAQALTLDRELLAELLGSEDLRELLDPESIAAVELELQGLLPERFPRDADEAHDLLVRLRDLNDDEAAARGLAIDWLRALEHERRAVTVRIAGEARWIAAEDSGRYREALGVTLPVGLPDAYLDPGSEPLTSLIRRWARTHVPFVASDIVERWGLATAAVEGALAQLVARGDVIAGEVRPSVRGREHCHPEGLRMLRRRSLAALRREVESVPPETLARFLPAWHGLGAPAGGGGRLLEVVFQLQGAALPASVIERDIIASRVAGYKPRLLYQMGSMGEVVWVGRGSLGSTDGRVALYLRGDAPRLVPEPADAPPADL